MSFLTNRTAFLLFFGLMIIQLLVYSYGEYILMEPRSIHSWRQTDCLSFAQNFYNGRGSFTEPCVNNLGTTGDGKVASDFPLLQYLIGNVWKITGVHTWIYRMVDLFFLMFGMIYVYRLYLFWFQTYVPAILASLLILTSPILAYYGATTISDVQSFGLSCAGFYYLVMWMEYKKNSSLLWAILLYSFAGLFKMSSAFIYGIGLSWFLIRVLFGEKESKVELFQLKNVVLLALPIFVWASWYLYAHHYNQLHPNPFFLIGIAPVWDMSTENFELVSMRFFHDIIPQMTHKFVLLVLLFGVIVFVSIKIKNFFTESLLRLLSPLAVFIMFVLLFFQVFDVHDYYLLNMVGALVVFLGYAIKLIFDYYPEFKKTNVVASALFIVFIPSVYITAIKTRTRIDADRVWGYRPIAMSKESHNFARWVTFDDRRRFAVLEKNKDSFEKYGIAKTDTILCIGDHTINRSLYLLGRVGYTDVNFRMEEIELFIEEQKKRGLKYLFILKPEMKEEKGVLPYLKDKIFEEEGLSVYRL